MNIQDEFKVAFEAIHKIETYLFNLQGEEVAKHKAGPISKRHEMIRKASRDVQKANALLGNANYTHFLAESKVEKVGKPHFMGEPI